MQVVLEQQAASAGFKSEVAKAQVRDQDGSFVVKVFNVLWHSA